MLEDIRFAKVNFFDSRLDKRFGFARADDNGETIHVHRNNFTLLRFEDETVVFNDSPEPEEKCLSPREGDRICFLSHKPLNKEHKPTAIKWNWAVKYDHMELPFNIRRRRREIIFRHGGIENVVGLCKRCKTERPIEVAPVWLRYESMPSDTSLFAVERHNLKDTKMICYGSGRAPRSLVRRITKFGAVATPEVLEVWDRTTSVIEEGNDGTYTVIDRNFGDAAIFISKNPVECNNFLKFGFVCPRAYRHMWSPARWGITTEAGGQTATLKDNLLNIEIYVGHSAEECFGFLKKVDEMLKTMSRDEMTLALLSGK